jgi:LytS/YehU family sensor histidine kinase
LQSSDELLIPAHEEAELLQQYLWLEQNRFPGRFAFSIIVDENAKSENVVTPPLLSHSLVEEALYLSVLNAETAKAYFIKIHFKLSDGTLIIEVTNNGIARKEALSMQQAKGLQRNEEQPFDGRLELINRKSAKPVEVKYSWYKEDGDDINSSTLNIPQN